MPVPLFPPARRLAPATVALALAAGVAVGGDAVIMPDGFVIRGAAKREKETVFEGGQAIRIDKANGFDFLDDGPRMVVFSTHVRKGGKVEVDVAGPESAVYRRVWKPIGSPEKIKPIAKADPPTEFDAKWQRVQKVWYADGLPDNIFQQITSIDPNLVMIAGIRHAWRGGMATNEFPPSLLRKLLSTHPDLQEPAGKPDLSRRLLIAQFFKDVGVTDPTTRCLAWFAAARAEVEKAKKDIPGDWGKEPTERADKLLADIDQAETRFIIGELEAAVGAGRYEFARGLLAGFTPKGADAKDNTRLADLKATVETVRPNYDRTADLLRGLIDAETVGPAGDALAAAGGTPAKAAAPAKKLDASAAVLVDAARVVLTELHPDSAGRVEAFRELAGQAERDRAAGRTPDKTPAELLALAVSGWLKGKNGADPNVEAAVRCWATREMTLAYLREGNGANRFGMLQAYQKAGKPLAQDELSQIISLLPPVAPEDPANLSGKKVPADKVVGIPDGIVRRSTGPSPGVPAGSDYFLRLPPEYHHGRAYPLVLTLGGPGLPPDRAVAAVAEFADRNGYVVAAPAWFGEFDKGQYDFSGKDHPAALAALRDVLRRFQIDPDRVFLFGYGEGANFALDLGMAHPDLFAGVAAMGPSLPHIIFRDYWRNTQKLPTYCVLGELAGSFENMRPLYEKWMPRGFPALMAIYKGRGLEWYRPEVPRIFDWMGRKVRVRGAGSLKLGQPGFEPWQVLREADDRFYWVGVGEGGLRKTDLLADLRPPAFANPAQFKADIGANGEIKITDAVGVKKFVVWLDKDLIDWSKKLVVTVNGGRPFGYVPQLLTPDLHLMFEELYRTGDRKMLYLGKLEINGPG